MKIGIFGDVHATKNMRTVQSSWEESVVDSIIDMYDVFSIEAVDAAICLGDFFDAPKLEAKHIHYLLPIFKMMEERSYPTYLLLGNHEISDDDHNILEYFREYNNIIPITEATEFLDDLVAIPYNVDPTTISPEVLNDKFIFTHHDIYGSALAGGKTSAFFGLDPSIFKNSNRVFNGHVHLRSEVTNNVLNAGSLVVSQHGELRIGDYPQYYVLDTNTSSLESYDNKHSLIYVTVDAEEISKVAPYNPKKLFVRIEYEGELPERPKDTQYVTFRKKISSIESKDASKIIRDTNLDLKNYLVEYITNDPEVTEKEAYIKAVMEVLD